MIVSFLDIDELWLCIAKVFTVITRDLTLVESMKKRKRKLNSLRERERGGGERSEAGEKHNIPHLKLDTECHDETRRVSCSIESVTLTG